MTLRGQVREAGTKAIYKPTGEVVEVLDYYEGVYEVEGRESIYFMVAPRGLEDV